MFFDDETQYSNKSDILHSVKFTYKNNKNLIMIQCIWLEYVCVYICILYLYVSLIIRRLLYVPYSTLVGAGCKAHVFFALVYYFSFKSKVLEIIRQTIMLRKVNNVSEFIM